MTEPGSSHVRIGIAIVEDAGRFLVGIRSAEQPLGGLHEFPGGKCNPDESPQQSAVRECLEETGLRVLPARELLRTVYAYPHATVDLHFWLCRPAAENDAQPLNGYAWVLADRLRELRFPEANASVIELLTGSG